MLESMSFSTVSFEELLGHCNEVLKKNQYDLSDLQDHLRFSSTYIPPLDFDEEEEEEEDSGLDSFELNNNFDNFERENNDIADEDPLLDETLSLKHFGISNVSLATIASQADSEFEVEEPDYQPHIKSLEVIEGNKGGEFDQYEDSKYVLQVSRDDYENLPKHMKNLVSWEDLLVAVEKMNSSIGPKKIKPDTFQQDEIESLGLGFKTRSYLLLLIKMNRLCVETNEGVICYRIL